MSGWTLERAESHLRELELFGMRLGLERMHALLSELGAPQRGLRCLHVVGTNGKSSTARMASGLLERHGLRTGTFLSPHLVSFAERIQVGGEALEPGDFAAAVERAAGAAAQVGGGDHGGDRITQFELLTAAALVAFRAREVDVAVMEAGLGGRLDATNVIGAPVVALTSVGLEHIRWLGDTLAAIAREKLAVVTPGATLVVGQLPSEALEQARAVERERPATLVHARPGELAEFGLPGYQRANFAVAAAAAEALIGPLDPEHVEGQARAGGVPGRLQIAGEDPLTVFDGAHNPDGMSALVDALDDLTGARPVVAVLSILDDKDAARMLDRLLPRCAMVVTTRSDNPRSLPPRRLEALCAERGVPVAAEADPRAALAHARRAAGPDGAVLVTGSLHLVGELLAFPDTRALAAR